jgi:signal peptidase
MLMGCYIFFCLIITLISLNLFAGFKIFINKSGSMEPVIKAGSLIVVKRDDIYLPGDIISFYAKDKDKEEIVTHRIVRLGGNVYITKGDANQAIDKYVLPRLVIGKVVLIFPYWGTFFTLVKTKIGASLFILLPAAILIGIETLKIIEILRVKPELVVGNKLGCSMAINKESLKSSQS